MIESINAKLQNWAQWQKRATFLDCGSDFVESDDKVQVVSLLRHIPAALEAFCSWRHMCIGSAAASSSAPLLEATSMRTDMMM